MKYDYRVANITVVGANKHWLLMEQTSKHTSKLNALEGVGIPASSCIALVKDFIMPQA